MTPLGPIPEKPQDELSEAELSALEAQKVDVDQNTTVAAVSYIYLLSVVALLARRDSRFVQFHARQGTALFCLALVALILPWGLRILVEFLLFLAMAYGFVHASQGRWTRIPGVARILDGGIGDTGAARAANTGFVGATGAVKKLLSLVHKEQGPPEPPQQPGSPPPSSGA